MGDNFHDLAGHCFPEVWYTGGMAKHTLNANALYQALYNGHLRKVINAVKAGSDLHPELPINLGGGGWKKQRLSPISMIWRWDWKGKPKTCLEALDTLLKAGADPNMPDDLGRRGLVLLLYIHGSQTPIDAMERLFEAKTDPLLSSFTTQGRSDANAMELCVLGWMPTQAQAIVKACPQAATTPSGPQEAPPLARLAANANGWTEEGGLQMTRLLLEHGASEDHRFIQQSPRALGWIAKTRAILMEERLAKGLPSPNASAPARSSPRF